MIDSGEGPLPIATEQVQRSPAQRGSLFGPAGIEETSYVVDELLPALRRHVSKRALGTQPGEALGPGARDLAIMLDDRGTLLLRFAPGCEGVIERWRCRCWRLCSVFNLFKMFGSRVYWGVLIILNNLNGVRGRRSLLVSVAV